MSIADTTSIIDRFLLSKTPEVLAISGAWGVGKTYLWKQEVEKHRRKMPLSRYCYVSLFGIGSMRDLRAAIIAKTLERSQTDGSFKAVLTTKEASEGLRATGGWLAGQLSKLKDLPIAKNISVGIDFFSGFLIRDSLIVFDDFERMGAGVNHDELLGFMSELKEEKGCKVVLIFNDTKLRDAGETYNRYREKVVDIEVQFAPTAKEAADLAFAGSAHKEQLIKCSTSLEIKNIRVLRKMNRFVKMVVAAAKGLDARVIPRAIPTVVLFTWSCYDSGANPPPTQFIKRWYLGWGESKARGDAPPSQEEKNWSAHLRGYGMTHFDDFDSTLLSVIKCGYIEGTGIIETAKNVDAQIKAGELDSEFVAAWRLFHDTFDDNIDLLVAEVERTFRRSVRRISPNNLSATLSLLRELGRGELADQLLEFYIATRQDEQDLFDLSRDPWRDQVTDAAVVRRFQEQFAAAHRMPTLRASVETMAMSRGWSQEEMQVLSDASEEALYALFKENHGPNLSKVVNACLMSWQPPHEHIRARALAALRRIGEENNLNAARIRRYLTAQG